MGSIDTIQSQCPTVREPTMTWGDRTAPSLIAAMVAFRGRAYQAQQAYDRHDPDAAREQAHAVAEDLRVFLARVERENLLPPNADDFRADVYAIICEMGQLWQKADANARERSAVIPLDLAEPATPRSSVAAVSPLQQGLTPPGCTRR